MRVLFLLLVTAAPLSSQTCELRNATPLTCLMLEYVRDLGAWRKRRRP